MNKTSKFINKLISDTKSDRIVWREHKRLYNKIQYVAEFGNEIVALILHMDLDVPYSFDLFIINRYKLTATYSEIYELYCVIQAVNFNKIKKNAPIINNFIKKYLK